MVLDAKWLRFKGCPFHADASGHIKVLDDLDLKGTGITSLGELVEVQGCLDLEDSDITSLGILGRVDGNVYLEGSLVTSLGSLQMNNIGDLWADGLGVEDDTTIEGFNKMIADYQARLTKMNPQDIPRELLKAEHRWQKALCAQRLQEKEA